MANITDVDIETTYEFIKEIYAKVDPSFLQGLSKLMEEKSDKFSEILKKERLEAISQEDLHTVLKQIFAIKRAMRKWDADHFEQMKDYMLNLLYGNDPLVERFNTFCDRTRTNLKITRPYEVASELLTYTNPLDYFLWANWIYNPEAQHGSLLLIFDEDFSLADAPSLGELYEQIIKSQNKLVDMAVELGISVSTDSLGNSVFDVPVFLCAVYAVYTFTVTKLRLTNEFNTILPQLDELLARLLGVYVNKKAEQVSAS